MKNRILTGMLAFAGCVLAFGAVAQTPVARPAIAAMEKGLDAELIGLWPNDPFLLLGPTRGVYLDGYGAVFTAELNLVVGPVITPMNPIPTKEMIAHQRERKLERLPKLREAMRTILANTASSLDTLPPDQQVVFAVTLLRYHWEDTTGMPAHIMMQGRRSDLLEARKAGPTALEQAVKVQEY